MNYNDLINGVIRPGVTYSYAMDSSATDKLIGEAGDIVQFWTDGDLTGVSVKFNVENSEGNTWYPARGNPITMPFAKMWVSWNAQAGKTLQISIGRGDNISFGGALVTLSAGAVIIGAVSIDQTTPGTTNRVAANLDEVNGTTLTGRDWSGDFANLDIALSALRDAILGGSSKSLTDLEGHLAPPSAFACADKDVTTAGTREALAGSTACREVIITAKAGNGNNVYIGGNTVSSTVFAKKLAAGEEYTVSIDNLSKIYLDVDTNGEGVTYGYVS